MSEICLLFGKPVIRDKAKFIEELKRVQSRSGYVIQALDANKVACQRHLTFAAEKALLAFFERRNIAKDLGVEILRYASGQRQIERAMSIGISGDTKRVAVVVICPKRENDGHKKIPDLSEIVKADGIECSFDENVLKAAFGITEEEVQAAGKEKIPDLVIERVALVDTYR
jgi:KEOPS complex subunit Cgi121